MKEFVALSLALMLPLGASADEPYKYDLRTRFSREAPPDEVKQGTVVQPRVESALMFVGNINLAEDPKDQVDLAGVEVAPGIYASHLGPRAEGFINYSLIGRVWEDSDYNEITQRLLTKGSYDAVPEWFRVSGQASYSDAVVDPSRSYNYGSSGLFDQNNLQERATASVTPEIIHDFRDFRFNARYTYGRVWYLDKNNNLKVPDRPIYSLYQDDSIDQDAMISVGTRGNGDRSVTGRVFYEWQDSEFQVTVPYRYERAGAEVGLRLTRTLRLVADGGVESDLDKSTTDGGLDTTFWHAGLNWRPDSKTSVDARFGERFFGNSWRVTMSRDTKYVTLRLDYIEDPEVETRRVGINFDPNQFPLPDPGSDLSGFTSLPYIRKDATATAIAEGARTKLRLDVYDRKREYVRLFPPDEETQGVRLSALRDLGAHMYGELEGRYEDVLSSRRNLDISDALIYHTYDRDFIGRLTWEAYENFKVAAEAGYLKRSGDTNYDGQWLAFRFRYTF